MSWYRPWRPVVRLATGVAVVAAIAVALILLAPGRERRQAQRAAGLRPETQEAQAERLGRAEWS